jgi:cell division GTPase FtsZ
VPSDQEARMQKSLAAVEGTPVKNVAAMFSPKSYRPAERQPAVVEDALSKPVAFRLSFLGAGQGGGRMADAFYGLGYRRVGVFNLTDSDFEGLHTEIPKLALDVGGAAKDMAFAAAQLAGRETEVWELLTDAWGSKTDYGIICVGLGGGSGSGTAPRLVEIARSYLETQGKPPRVGAIVSLPRLAEGQQICRNAVQALKRLLDLGTAPLIIMDNDRINTVFKPTAGNAHKLANTLVSNCFHVFNERAEVHSDHTTFDRGELAQILDEGIVVMGATQATGAIQGPTDVSRMIREELTHNVLAEADLRLGKKGCVLFVASDEIFGTFTNELFDAGIAQLDRLVGSGYKGEQVTPVVHPGIYHEADSQGLQVYVMVSGMPPPAKRLAELAKKADLDGTAAHRMGLAGFLGLE